jgi:hypothetical protein
MLVFSISSEQKIFQINNTTLYNYIGINFLVASPILFRLLLFEVVVKQKSSLALKTKELFL